MAIYPVCVSVCECVCVGVCHERLFTWINGLARPSETHEADLTACLETHTHAPTDKP